MDDRIFDIRFTDLAHGILAMQNMTDIKNIAAQLAALAKDTKADIDKHMDEHKRRRNAMVMIETALSEICIDILASGNEGGRA